MHRGLAYSRRRFGGLLGGSLLSGSLIAGRTGSLMPAACGQLEAPSQPLFEDRYLWVVRQPIVHDELRLTQPQMQAVRQATDAVDASWFLLRDLSPVARATKSEPLIRHVQRKLAAALSPMQQRRLAQIVAQANGHRALLGEAVGAELRLTNSQRKQFRDAVEETEKAKAKVNESIRRGGDRQAAEKELLELLTNEREQFIDLLNPVQKRNVAQVFGAAVKLDTQTPPRIKAPAMPLPGPWINSEPLTLEKLRGKVVALHFYAFA